MRKQILRLATVRLLAGITMLIMGLGMASCQPNADLQPKTLMTSDSTTVRTLADADPRPPEKPAKPGGN